MQKNNKTKRQQGFSFIDILVGLALFSIILFTTVTFVITQKKFTKQKNKQLHSIGKAGFWGCKSLYSDIPIQGLNNKNPMIAFARKSAGWQPALPTELQKKVAANSDVLFINAVKLPPTHLIENVSGMSDTIITPKSFKVKVNDEVIISDCYASDVVKIRAIQVLAKGNELRLNQKLSKSYSKNAYVMPRDASFFYLGNTARKDKQGKPVIALYKQPLQGRRQELVENVSHLQFDFATQQNNEVYYMSAEKILAWQEVKLVKITVQMEENHFHTEVALRNAQ